MIFWESDAVATAILSTPLCQAGDWFGVNDMAAECKTDKEVVRRRLIDLHDGGALLRKDVRIVGGCGGMMALYCLPPESLHWLMRSPWRTTSNEQLGVEFNGRSF